MTTGLFGRCLLTFTSTRSTFIFPSSFTPRDIVEIYDSSHMNIGRAVIYRVKEKAMTVVMEEYVDKKEIINGGTFRMLKVANQVYDLDLYIYLSTIIIIIIICIMIIMLCGGVVTIPSSFIHKYCDDYYCYDIIEHMIVIRKV